MRIILMVDIQLGVILLENIVLRVSPLEMILLETCHRSTCSWDCYRGRRC